MLEERTLDFIKKQILDLNDFSYKLEDDGEYIYIIFSEALGKDIEKEFTFKLIDETLFMHTTSYGWKPVEKGAANKYFWIELLK
ncbi:hypothetical protein CRU99_04760 [Malaciobacter mytili]|uniref:DUF695 domain-containing protein n=1 Tax=Malaciobacter mytili LMG 24559 TaxID=1032238 RepID=A0AAX2AEM5_9BACT|nr:hypothetical protein [Malaciobacter mytili]AXH13655.1 hypothetical protein AMYT_0028 [Malaciobacter mytili LMG 24559]RXI44661.1 hypothetical protein CRU99_04760 [Malaciobacter mytili]RXK13838.1 hypothetical protein CP985_12900 [Malaciobacter mytili LMG 24559]